MDGFVNGDNRENTMICPRCRSVITAGIKFCPYCGENVGAAPQAPAPVVYRGINPMLYMHDTDRQALSALTSIPGFTPLLKYFMSIWNERQFRIQNMSSNIRLGPEQMPKYYNMLPPICEKLGINIPELYMTLDVVPNAWTFGDTNPFITLTSGLIETMPEELIPTVIAHECGHIACHHTLYTTMGSILLNGTLVMIGKQAVLLSLPLQIAFSYWMRCSELSADRAAAICDGSAENITEMCMRFAGYDKNIPSEASKQLFMEQALEYKELVATSVWNKTLEFLIVSGMDHPLNAVRAFECDQWSKTDQFRYILQL